MRPVFHTLAALALCAASALPARAGRPLQTDDAGVLEGGVCEVEGYTERVLADGASVRSHSLQFGCGVGASTQLALAAARTRADGAHASLAELNGKTRLWHGQAGSGSEPPALTLAYALSGARLPGPRWHHAATEVGLLYSRPLVAQLALHANLGHARDELSDARSTTWGLAVEHAGVGAFAPMAELFGDDRDAAWWNLGLRWTVAPDKAYVDISYGRQMTSARPRLVTLGFKLVF